VVGRDLAHVLTVEPVDCGSKGWEDEGSGADQNRRRLNGVFGTVKDGSRARGSAQLVHVVARHVV